MGPKNEEFVTNGKILHSLEGKLILEAEEEKFSPAFVEQFLSLLETAEGTLLLAFVDVEELEEKYAEHCAQILSSKLERGQKVYCIAFCKTISHIGYCAWQIRSCMN